MEPLLSEKRNQQNFQKCPNYFLGFRKKIVTDSKENHLFTTQIVDDFVHDKQAYM